MKTKILVLGMVLSLFMIGCNKDDDNKTQPLTSEEIAANAQMDNISDDVTYMAEAQSDETPATRLTGGAESFFSCATVTTVQNGNTWVRTIDFGDVNCTLFNGNQVRGKIIITFSNDFNAQTRTIAYTFDNFYHNNRHVEGNRTVVKTILSNGHPQATIDLDLTVTTPNNQVFHRTGQRVREFTAGYDTPYILHDNVFSISGSWATTFPSGMVQTANITAPLIVRWNCLHIVSGTIAFARNSNSAVLDYGDGECDNQATITINGVLHNITL